MSRRALNSARFFATDQGALAFSDASIEERGDTPYVWLARGDVLLALSTSGNSLSVLDALAQARRLGLATIALVGYDGGRVAAEQLADHVIVTPSQHIPRIQEAQATAYHLLRELVEAG